MSDTVWIVQQGTLAGWNWRVKGPPVVRSSKPEAKRWLEKVLKEHSYEIVKVFEVSDNKLVYHVGLKFLDDMLYTQFMIEGHVIDGVSDEGLVWIGQE